MRQGRTRSTCLTRCSAGRAWGRFAGTTDQNTPLKDWQQFAQGAGNLGGVGGTIDQTGTNSQTLQGNPLLGGIGGYQLWNALFGGGK